MAEETSAKPPSNTLDLLFDLVRESPEAQLRASDSVESKIFQSLGAGSLLIGLAALRGQRHDAVVAVFLVIAVAAFIVAAVVAIFGLWTRKFRAAIEPRQLWEKYWLDSADAVKHAFVDDIADGFAHNEQHIAAKHRVLRVVLLAVTVEAAAIGAAVIASTV